MKNLPTEKGATIRIYETNIKKVSGTPIESDNTSTEGLLLKSVRKV